MQPDQHYFYRSFSHLSNEELADKYANQHLADEARAAIGQLLAERGVEAQSILRVMAEEFAAIDPPPPVSGRVEHPVPTEVVGQYSTAVEAEMICSLLAQAGIAASMADAQTVTTNHLWSNAIGGVRVKVPFTDVEAAQAVIASWQADDFALPEEDAEEDDAPAFQIGVGDWVPGYLRGKSRELLFRRFMAMMTDFLLFFVVISLFVAGGGIGWLAASMPPMGSLWHAEWYMSFLSWPLELNTVELEILASLPYFWLLEGLTGYTLGKYLWRVRVVDCYGKRTGLLKALPRTLLRLIELNPYLFGVVIGGGVAVMSKTGQRLGDMAGGTYVVDVEVLQTAGQR